MNELPPNATKQEIALAEAIDFQLDAHSLRGFKFNPPDHLLPWLIDEYGLNDLLPFLPEPKKAIIEGVKWQRLRGTPSALGLALSWINIDNVRVEEEYPGQHFYGFQVGLGNVPSGDFVRSTIALAKLSAPLRARLTRIYNHDYDIRRFKLDDSTWGNLLSDYSGIRLSKDGPVLSFGRLHKLAFDVAKPELIQATARNYHVNTVSNDNYRLSEVTLSESSWHTTNYQSSFGRIYSNHNQHGLRDEGSVIEIYQHLVKAQIILSDNSILGDNNSCFPSFEDIEIGDVSRLSINYLSEQINRSITKAITFRKEKKSNIVVITSYLGKTQLSYSRSYFFKEHYKYKNTIAQNIRNHSNNTIYTGVISWHGFIHQQSGWNKTAPLLTLN